MKRPCISSRSLNDLTHPTSRMGSYPWQWCGTGCFFFFLVAQALMSCFAVDALVWSTEMVVALMSRPLRDISLQKNLSPPSQGKRATQVSSFSSQTLSLSAILHNSSVCASTNTSVSGLSFNGSFNGWRLNRGNWGNAWGPIIAPSVPKPSELPALYIGCCLLRKHPNC